MKRKHDAGHLHFGGAILAEGRASGIRGGGASAKRASDGVVPSRCFCGFLCKLHLQNGKPADFGTRAVSGPTPDAALPLMASGPG